MSTASAGRFPTTELRGKPQTCFVKFTSDECVFFIKGLTLLKGEERAPSCVLTLEMTLY